MSTQQLYQIEKNVPLTPIYGRPKSKLVDLVKSMGGGDCITFNKANDGHYLCALISKHCPGYHGVFRTLVDKKGFRVWKMKKETKTIKKGK